MESSSSSFPSFEYSLSHWDYLDLYILRPILAILFTFSLISLGWFLAWKLVLVHVPLVQEIFGLRKKPAKSKPPTRRLSKFYDSLNSQTSASGCLNLSRSQCWLDTFLAYPSCNSSRSPFPLWLSQSLPYPYSFAVFSHPNFNIYQISPRDVCTGIYVVLL
ncbi:uncharacterized protein LOC103488423 isoform X1 [Cucumis melo]|uniref:Uncharacterized protein LOC103488423 isoform X1 n=2 Tax=Cucumis melo TaxID=3656 RepID=A0ABM3KJZ0_CUCME|nr:uncharacterized protein LOC103488423 isoform X1 [Cucumis melo]